MIYSKGMKELKVMLTYANGTIKRNIFGIDKGWIESMLIIIIIASGIKKKQRKKESNNKSQQHKNNNEQVFECLTNTRPQNTTTNINLEQMK